MVTETQYSIIFHDLPRLSMIFHDLPWRFGGLPCPSMRVSNRFVFGFRVALVSPSMLVGSLTIRALRRKSIARLVPFGMILGRGAYIPAEASALISLLIKLYSSQRVCRCYEVARGFLGAKRGVRGGLPLI